MAQPSSQRGESASAVPPAYENATDENINEVLEDFYKLDLNPDTYEGPTVDTCLAHPKLLSAFDKLRRRMADYEGLWDIWNSRAQNANPSALNVDGRADDILAKLREKRWSIYVVRAVDRYEAWWQSFVPRMLLEDDMLATSSTSAYESFTSTDQLMCWTTNILPPLGKPPLVRYATFKASHAHTNPCAFKMYCLCGMLIC